MNISTCCTHLVILIIPNELSPSVFSSDFKVSVLPTRPSYFVLTNLKHILTNADTIYLSLTVNFNAFAPLHAQKHSHPKTFLLTNLAVFPSVVITYNPALRSLSSVIHTFLSYPPLNRCASVFKATPLVEFRRTKLHTTTPSKPTSWLLSLRQQPLPYMPFHFSLLRNCDGAKLTKNK